MLGEALDFPRSGGNHFDRNKSTASRLTPTMHAPTIFIQRPYRQATLLAKSRPQQSTRFKLADQGLDFGKTTPPVNHSHFAHCSSATLNTKQQQRALLRRIRPCIHATGRRIRTSRSPVAIGIGEASDSAADDGTRGECCPCGSCAWFEREPALQVAPCFRTR